ncbi:MAG TPA: hypothetical protein VHQ47_17860 [Phycisphaerae bacterium]|nr:hypothetical protein [Phycisphaerae bacterium]
MFDLTLSAISPTWAIIMAAASPPPAPPPAPHARTKPDITLGMLEALKRGCETFGGILRARGFDGCALTMAKCLFNRGLAERKTYYGNRREYVVSDNGRMLIRTQYDALKKVLTDTL